MGYDVFAAIEVLQIWEYCAELGLWNAHPLSHWYRQGLPRVLWHQACMVVLPLSWHKRLWIFVQDATSLYATAHHKRLPSPSMVRALAVERVRPTKVRCHEYDRTIPHLLSFELLCELLQGTIKLSELVMKDIFDVTYVRVPTTFGHKE